MRTSNRLRRNRGQALLEFALLLPILLMLTMVTIQYGILIHTRLTLYHVSRNAGRFAAVRAMQPGMDADIRDYTVDMAAGLSMTINPANIYFYAYNPDSNINTVVPENTLNNNTNRGQYSWLKMRIIYDTRQKLFLPSTFMGIPIFSQSMTVDNIIMLE